jgi:hypothetical protein
MDKHKQIRSLLKTMAAEVGPDFSMLAQVKSVDEGAMTCDLFDEESGLDFYDVRLRPVLDGNEAVTLIPKVNTWVLAVKIEDSEDWMIVACGEVDKWRLKVGEATVEQDATGLLIGKGSDTVKQALTLICEAVQQIVVMQGTDPNYGKLTQALTKINNLLR